ncbi:hypothetical protein PUNSTDRAFT_139703 [Punctularia strigosozonata HHB-11173 SS5]|uniref:Uncharacterized protein n=1 Tax=Punctularia strigosozonata (strain HHB-11173) TaxID=741275 RepID=R7S0B6_PUNST|nr:uncharacterized protein PUNSTDRAFT_139703 [Punctularia strigosozonata HHB-11173 SS5]EIN03274.1 hypothetical protein PUNSTDRAFT_139703 [Punctularia strigosozonata HHB-11173 SS5]
MSSGCAGKIWRRSLWVNDSSTTYVALCTSFPGLSSPRTGREWCGKHGVVVKATGAGVGEYQSWMPKLRQLLVFH